VVCSATVELDTVDVVVADGAVVVVTVAFVVLTGDVIVEAASDVDGMVVAVAFAAAAVGIEVMAPSEDVVVDPLIAGVSAPLVRGRAVVAIVVGPSADVPDSAVRMKVVVCAVAHSQPSPPTPAATTSKSIGCPLGLRLHASNK